MFSLLSYLNRRKIYFPLSSCTGNIPSKFLYIARYVVLGFYPGSTHYCRRLGFRHPGAITVVLLICIHHVLFVARPPPTTPASRRLSLFGAFGLIIRDTGVDLSPGGELVRLFVYLRGMWFTGRLSCISYFYCVISLVVDVPNETNS